MLDPFTIAIAALGIFLIAFMKGAFGGGFAIIGIPLLSLVMDPVTAGGLLAPMFVIMDLVALKYWKPSTWSKPELKLLIPGLCIGFLLGFMLLKSIDRPTVALLVGGLTLAMTGQWLLGTGEAKEQPRNVALGVSAGAASGFTSMVAHSGGPPLIAYLLTRGLPKAVYAGTSSAFFTIGNVFKAVPWLIIAQPDRNVWLLMLVLVPVVPLGVWAGWKLHNRLDQKELTRACYLLLIVTSLKLVWDGLRGQGLI